MEGKKIKILTIIVTYNGVKWINKCIDSLQLSSLPTDIYVIDNGSVDETVSVLKKYSGIYIYESKINLGFGQANNIGLKYALDNNYDYVFLLNQDAWVEEDTLKFLCDIAEMNNDYGVLSPMHYFSDEKSLEYNFSVQLSPWFCKNIVSDFIIKKRNQMQEIYPLNFINAAAWFVPRKALEIVGGFDPIFFHYGEDNNYCNRLKFHGLNIGIIPSAKIYHDCLDANNNVKSSKEELRKFEIEMKVQFANINVIINRIDIVNLAFKLFVFGTINLVKLNFTKAKMQFLKSKIVIENCNKIIKSRADNMIVRSNYL